MIGFEPGICANGSDRFTNCVTTIPTLLLYDWNEEKQGIEMNEAEMIKIRIFHCSSLTTLFAQKLRKYCSTP